MTDDIDKAYLMPPNSFAASRLGQVATTMGLEGSTIGHDGMEKISEICLRRGHDDDPDVQMLIRHVLFSYANSRGINVLALPLNHAH